MDTSNAAALIKLRALVADLEAGRGLVRKLRFVDDPAELSLSVAWVLNADAPKMTPPAAGEACSACGTGRLIATSTSLMCPKCGASAQLSAG